MIRCAALALTLLATGCADHAAARFPSLLPRAAEKASMVEPEIVVPVATPDPALDARVATATQSIATTHSAFADAVAKTEPLVTAAQGATVGSEGWIAAQTALAQLDTYRADSSTLVADLEQVAIDRGTAGLPPYLALDAAHDAAQAEFDAEAAKIGELSAKLPQS
jgi:hypothetical protein